MSNLKRAETGQCGAGFASTSVKGVVPERTEMQAGFRAKALLNRSEQLDVKAGIGAKKPPTGQPPTGHDGEEVRP